MTEFTIKIADRVVAVRTMFTSTRDYCRDYLCETEPDFAVEISKEDIAYEWEKSLQEARLEGKPIRDFADAYLEITAVQRSVAEQLFAYDTLLFHGSVVAVDGQGYLFTAKSGTGKSTHTRLWREVLGDRAVVVNDDKPFLRITDEGIWACGSPWNGKHRLGSNLCVPLKAVCILERGEENKIQPISAKQVLSMLLQQSNRPGSPIWMPKYLELLDRLAGGVAFYRLACNMDPQAALVSYQAMSGNRKDDEI